MQAESVFDELQQVIEINSHTKNKAGVDRNGEIFSDWLHALGFSMQRHRREHIGDHLHFQSSKAPGPKLLLLGHLDTVFPEKTFVDFKQDENWIYGPGVCDMKGGNHVALSALRNIFKSQGGIKNIDMLLVSDEETGSDDSKKLTASLATQYDACLVFEAAGKNGEVVIGRKGVGTFNIEITGKPAHAGNHYSEGINANLAAAKMIIALTELTDLSKQSTVNVGKMQGGIGANTISPKASLLAEIRYTLTTEKARLLLALDKIITDAQISGVQVNVTGGIQRDVMEPTEQQSALISHIENLIGEPLPTEKRGGVSDANIVSAVGVPTIDGFGPFGDGDHTRDERACKKSFQKRIEQVTKVLAFYNAR